MSGFDLRLICATAKDHTIRPRYQGTPVTKGGSPSFFIASDFSAEVSLTFLAAVSALVY